MSSYTYKQTLAEYKTLEAGLTTSAKRDETFNEEEKGKKHLTLEAQ